ncbi:MAG: DUF2470 domain-containing protein, partial [Beijerinckiaceae bacterium]
HREAVRLYATRLAGEPDGHWRCIAIDPDGIDLALGDRLTRIFFPARVTDAVQLRKMLKSLADQARSSA